jgi:thiamine thiazole synthase
MEKLLVALEFYVAIVETGPSGLMAGYCLAREDKNIALFEKKLSIGGGMWGCGMMFNEIVIQEEAKGI